MTRIPLSSLDNRAHRRKPDYPHQKYGATVIYATESGGS